MTNLSPSSIPHPADAFVEAINQGNLQKLLAVFAEDALVNDQLHDYWGSGQITLWASRDIIDDEISLHATSVTEHYGNVILTAIVDGKFEKRGLPDPLILTFYFSSANSKIVQLIILRNELGA